MKYVSLLASHYIHESQTKLIEVMSAELEDMTRRPRFDYRNLFRGLTTSTKRLEHISFLDEQTRREIRPKRRDVSLELTLNSCHRDGMNLFPHRCSHDVRLVVEQICKRWANRRRHENVYSILTGRRTFYIVFFRSFVFQMDETRHRRRATNGRHRINMKIIFDTDLDLKKAKKRGMADDQNEYIFPIGHSS